MGRAVDGRFKSARTAALALPWIWNAVERYLFEEFPDSHRSDGISFRQDRDARLTSLGLGGSPCEYNDDFLIATSLPQLKYTASEQLGVRTTNGVYLNSRMQDLLRTRSPSDIRADCVNPSLLWVQVGAQWFKALRSDAARIFDLPPGEQIAKYCRDPLLRAIHRLHREELARRRLSAIRRNEEQSANERSGMTVPSEPSEGEDSETASYADLEMPTLDEYGEL
jgi:putative transposase